jgi:hypothetical protein
VKKNMLWKKEKKQYVMAKKKNVIVKKKKKNICLSHPVGVRLSLSHPVGVRLKIEKFLSRSVTKEGIGGNHPTMMRIITTTITYALN